jgi:hypothetical protein
MKANLNSNPLDDKIAQPLRALSKPPQRATSKGIVAPGFHSGEGGVSPMALQSRQLKFKRLANSDHLASPPQLLSGCIRCLQ